MSKRVDEWLKLRERLGTWPGGTDEEMGRYLRLWGELSEAERAETRAALYPLPNEGVPAHTIRRVPPGFALVSLPPPP